MRDLTEEVIRTLGSPRRLYWVIQAMGFSLLGMLWMTGALRPRDLLESAATLVFLPLFFHWITKGIRGADTWRPTTLEKKVEKVAWRLGIDESVTREAGVHSYGGAYLDAPDALETYLPPSFERAGGDPTSELWVSRELRAHVRREGLEVRIVHYEDEESFRRALPGLGPGGGSLAPGGGR